MFHPFALQMAAQHHAGVMGLFAMKATNIYLNFDDTAALFRLTQPVHDGALQIIKNSPLDHPSLTTSAGNPLAVI